MTARAMWAPWRMQYIRGPKSDGCIFCDYPAAGVEHHRENLILCTRPTAFVMLNRYPFAAAHLMVVPRRHTPSLEALPAAEFTALFELVRDATAVLTSSCNADGMNIGVNLGAAAGAGLAEHLHVHLVPRWRGDLNFMPVIGDVHVMPEALDATHARLAPLFHALTRRSSARSRPRSPAVPSPATPRAARGRR